MSSTGNGDDGRLKNTVKSGQSNILIVDDVLQGGSIAKTRFSVPRRQRTIHKRMRNFLWEISHNDCLESCILPVGDGVAICYKKSDK